MKTLIDYIAERKPEYRVRVKFLNPNPFRPKEEEASWISLICDRLEAYLEKYGLLEISAPAKTSFQSKPLDFPQIDHGEVFVVDAVLGYPVGVSLLQDEIQRHLKLRAAEVVVKTPTDPSEIDEERYHELLDQHDADNDGEVDQVVLLDTPDYAENEDNSVGYAGEPMLDEFYKAWKLHRENRGDLMNRFEASNEADIEYPKAGEISSGPERETKGKKSVLPGNTAKGN